jgi:chaperonin GroEL (HSP60 family)
MYYFLGTTSVVILSCSLLENALILLNQSIHPIKIINAYSKAKRFALNCLEEVAIPFDPFSEDGKQIMIQVLYNIFHKFYLSVV